MLLFAFLIIQRLISQVHLVGTTDKTVPEICIWQESKTLLQQGSSTIDLPMAFMLNSVLCFPLLNFTYTLVTIVQNDPYT